MAEESTQGRKTLYKDPTFSDITIHQSCDGKKKEYVAHKAVLCNHSGWFMRAFTGKFMESSETTIEVHDDDPDLFEAMMFFFYHMDFDKQSGLFSTADNPKSTVEELTDIIDCYTLADKYDARMFMDALLNRFKQLTVPFTGTLKESDINALVHAHYPYCTRTMCAMSEILVTFIIYRTNLSQIFGSKKVQELVLQYGNFGADLLVLGMRSRKLSVPHLQNNIQW